MRKSHSSLLYYHYVVVLFQNVSTRHTVELIIDRMFPQTFRTYTFNATNERGHQTHVVKVIQGTTLWGQIFSQLLN